MQAQLLRGGLIAVLTLMLVELGLRAIAAFGPRGYSFEAYLSADFMQVFADGSVRYAPNRQIRIATRLDDRVLYDQRYPTNSLGLVDTVEYLPRAPQPRIAVLGDSFTVGQGAAPWFPQFRERLAEGQPQVTAYNLGLSGAGVMQMADLYRALAPQLAPDAILMPLICDDFHRRRWAPVRDATRWHLCARERYDRNDCAQPDRSFGFIVADGQLPSAGVDAAAGANSAVALDPTLPWPRYAFHWLRQRSHLLNRLNQLRLQGAEQRALDALEEQNIAALAALKRQVGPARLHLVHFDVEHDPRTTPRCDRLRARLAAQGLELADLRVECALTSTDRIPVDAHYTAAGYAKLSACLQRYVRQRLLPAISAAPPISTAEQ